MSTQQNNRVGDSLHDSTTALIGVFRASNKLIPGVVFATLLIVGWVISATITSGAPLIGAAALAVLITSVIVFAKSNSYGEATLALIGGLLTVFSVTWTVPYFWIFNGVLASFSLFALIIASVKLAGEHEAIILQAATFYDPHDIDATVRKLEEIDNKPTQYRQLHSIAKVKALRLLVFRQIPISDLEGALQLVEYISMITKVEPNTAALFVADMTKALEARPHSNFQVNADRMLDAMRNTPVPPEDFIKAFQNSRRLILSPSVDLARYFQELEDYLENGVAPEEMYEVLKPILIP